VKYIDPSYMIRSVAANASDAIFCDGLARHAVHAGMAGFTDVLVGRWHRRFTSSRSPRWHRAHRRIDPDGGLWLAGARDHRPAPAAPPRLRRVTAARRAW
jgi:6-phosphofructokinase 1